MNCREFQNIIHELAGGQVAEGARQIEAFEHAGRCLWCAMRLDEETRLTENLQAFAGILRGRNAPNRVEEALLQAFRERNSGAAPARFWFVPKALGRGLSWGAALAGALAITFLVILHWPHDRSRPRTPATQSVGKLQAGLPAPSLASSAQAERAAARAAGAAQQTEGLPPEQPFISLGTCDDSQCMDEVTLVRVTLPAEAPLAFGVGSDTDDFSEGPVQADVALGSDGAPFAIRFVN